MSKKTKISKKQKETLKRMQKTRQIDSDNLRALIEQKLKWVIQERTTTAEKINKLNAHDIKLQGILLFIKDLTEPIVKQPEVKK